MDHSPVIIDVLRTPMGRGKPGGSLSGVHPVDLLAGVLRSLVSQLEYALLVGQIIENPMLNGETIRLDGALRITAR